MQIDCNKIYYFLIEFYSHIWQAVNLPHILTGYFSTSYFDIK